ncbi:hypothetical protein V5799_034059 [Amblyomma americanum]|uniref:Uncharacterized protein n=1 Tax=Amblyomma americanum TaxID=6943 RepID=A0AAQ4DLJ4_AMBAM
MTSPPLYIRTERSGVLSRGNRGVGWSNLPSLLNRITTSPHRRPKKTPHSPLRTEWSRYERYLAIIPVVVCPP